jgi:hypothetical protein
MYERRCPKREIDKSAALSERKATENICGHRSYLFGLRGDIESFEADRIFSNYASQRYSGFRDSGL